jgi:sensor c-di-GMP phosphodiesterase-like protein
LDCLRAIKSELHEIKDLFSENTSRFAAQWYADVALCVVLGLLVALLLSVVVWRVLSGVRCPRRERTSDPEEQSGLVRDME